MRLSRWIAGCSAGIVALGTTAAPVQWTIESGGNGHWYEYFDDASGFQSWSEASAAAASRVHAGQKGYLATVTSSGENAFIHTLTAGNRTWLGASDAGDEGNWTWRTGPESGQTLNYANWHPWEPNNLDFGNSYGDEDYLVMNFPHLDGQWNDIPLAAYGSIGYVVEYAQAIPEPSTYALMGLGLCAVAFAARRRGDIK